ncbi:MAG: hypothetical protein M3285_13000, partial [Actinomycetota bacterium]|nr:hypothetical protein [Actinomycetota bacterium]
MSMRQRGSARVFTVVLMVLVVVSLSAIALLVAAGGSDYTRITSLRRLQKERVVYYPARQTFVVLLGDGVTAVYGRAPTAAGTETVRYCPSSGLFETTGSGAKFDSQGRYYGGPAPRGLRTFPAKVEEGIVRVNFKLPVSGLPRSSDVTEPIGPFCDPYALGP